MQSQRSRTTLRWRRCAWPAREDGVRAVRAAAAAERARDGRDDPAQIHHLFVAPPRRSPAATARPPRPRRIVPGRMPGVLLWGSCRGRAPIDAALAFARRVARCASGSGR